jgi:mRNA interferase HigB
VNVISRKALQAFAVIHPDAGEPLDRCYHIARKARWLNLNEVRKDFPHADAVGECTIFNVAGNKYRLIVKIRYAYQDIYVRFVLTHAVYKRGGWNNDCGA